MEFLSRISDIRNLCHLLRATFGNIVPLLEDIPGGETKNSKETRHDNSAASGKKRNSQARQKEVQFPFVICFFLCMIFLFPKL